MTDKEYEYEKWCHYSGMPSPKAYEKKDKINNMTEEDIKYRQGRSRKKAEDTYKLLFISLIGMIAVFIIAAFIG